MIPPKRREIRLSLVLVVLPVFAAAGCAGLFPEGPESRPASLNVTVENHQWSDVTVYLVRDETRFRLGFVRAQSEESFRVSAARLGGALDFRLFADPVGSDRFVVTGPIQVPRGGTTVWSIEASSNLSTVVIR